MANPVLREQEYTEQAAPTGSPAAGRRWLYAKADGWYERDSAGTERKVGPSAGQLTSRLTAAASSSVTGYGSTGLSVPLAANKVYEVKAFGHYRTAAAGTGIGLRLNTAAVNGLVVASLRYTITVWNASTPTLLQATALTTPLLTPAVAAAATDYTWEVRGLIRVGATGGPLLVEYASEAATSAVTIQPDSYLMAQEVA